MVGVIRKTKTYYLLSLGYLIVAVGLLYYAWRLEATANDTNDILNGEVQEKDATIAQLSFVLNEQAAPAVIYLLRNCKRNNIQCPEVLLSPTEPPFDEQLAIQNEGG